MVIWIRHAVERNINRRNQAAIFRTITSKIHEALQNPLTSEAHKQALLKELEEIERLRIDAERDQLQLVLKEAK